jgi:uncharacterized protein (DUF1684 family)
MKYVVLAIMLLASGPSSAQVTYKDSLKVFRAKYLLELAEIIRNDTQYITFYPPAPALRVQADVALLSNEKTFRMITSSGTSKEAQKYARVSFNLKGKTYHLYLYQLLALKNKKETSGHLFLPFIDLTSGKESYGGGRYIDIETGDIGNGKLTIDFNKAYNPYCAFTTGYNCPLPPRENTLPLSVRAGEKYNKKKFQH